MNRRQHAHFQFDEIVTGVAEKCVDDIARLVAKSQGVRHAGRRYCKEREIARGEVIRQAWLSSLTSRVIRSPPPRRHFFRKVVRKFRRSFHASR